MRERLSVSRLNCIFDEEQRAKFLNEGSQNRIILTGWYEITLESQGEGRCWSKRLAGNGIAPIRGSKCKVKRVENEEKRTLDQIFSVENNGDEHEEVKRELLSIEKYLCRKN